MIFAAAFIGYSIGTAPIIGYHDGAENYTELKGLLHQSLTMIAIFGIGMVISAVIACRTVSKYFCGI